MITILINPPQNSKYPQPPLGLASIAAVLEKNNYPVEILDANTLQLSEIETVKKVKNAYIVGITAMTPHINSAIRIAKGIKQNNPDIIVTMGGPHVTILPQETLANVPEIDIIVRGEGEETIVELYDALENRKPLDSVRGITYRDGGYIKSTQAREPIIDLNALPFPAYHLLPINLYKLHPPHGRRHPYMAMMTSRGCPYKCIYCSKPIFGSKFRAQSPERTVDEIEYLNKKFGIKEIIFYDDSFTLDKNRIMQLTEDIKNRGLEIAWTCETRVNLVNEELLKNMKNAGCYLIAYGIESGSQMILNELRKGIALDQVTDAINITHKAGIQTVGYFMMGSPEETPETIRQTIDFAKKQQLDFAQFSVTIPFPGTDLYKLYLKEGSTSQINWDDFIYANLESSSAPVFETDLLSREELIRWNAKAYREFYLRLSYILRRLAGIRSIEDIKTNLKGLKMFLSMN